MGVVLPATVCVAAAGGHALNGRADGGHHPAHHRSHLTQRAACTGGAAGCHHLQPAARLHVRTATATATALAAGGGPAEGVATGTAVTTGAPPRPHTAGLIHAPHL